MRASATSRISHHASVHASQGPSNAAKADEASPFALLVADAAKPSQQKDAQTGDKSGDKTSDRQDDKQAVAGKTDTKANTKADKTAAADDTAKPAAQADKTDKSEDKTEHAAAAPDAAAELPQPDIQPQPVAAPQVQPLPLAANNAAAANDDGTDETAPVGEAAKPAAPAPAALQAAAEDAADPQAKTAAAQQPANSNDVKAAKPAPRKTDDIKTGEKTADTKADAKPDFAPEVAKADAAQDVPKPAAQPASAANNNAANTNLAANAIPGAPAAQSPSAAPVLAQHVEVTAKAPTPDLPKLGVEIAARSLSGARQFDIRLDPPELGRVEVRLSIDAAGKASAHLSADQPQTLDLLQKDASGLTRALRDAGLNVSQDGLNFSLRQQAGGSQEQGGRNTARGSALSLHASTSIEPTGASAVTRTLAHGRVDISV